MSDAAYTELYHQYFAEFQNTVDVQGIIDNAYSLIKPYVEKLFAVCKDDVNIIVAEELGDGRKISSATDDELIKLDNIYNRLVTKATLLGIEV